MSDMGISLSFYWPPRCPGLKQALHLSSIWQPSIRCESEVAEKFVLKLMPPSISVNPIKFSKK